MIKDSEQIACESRSQKKLFILLIAVSRTSIFLKHSVMLLGHTNPTSSVIDYAYKCNQFPYIKFLL